LATALSLDPCTPRASHVDPNAIPSGASAVDPDAISLPTEQRNPKPEIEPHPDDSGADGGPKTLHNPGTINRWSIWRFSNSAKLGSDS